MLSLLTVVAVLGSGCAGPASPRVDRETILQAEEAAVIQLGLIEAAAHRQAAVSIVAPRLKEMLQELVDELAYVADCPIPCRVRVVNSPVIHAFALPTGDIFIYAGMLDLVENRDQLAVVLGHEVAHIKHKDGLRKVRQMLNEQEKAAVTAALLGAVVGGAASGALGGILGGVVVDPLLTVAYHQYLVGISCNVAARLAASLPQQLVLDLMRQSIGRYSQATELRADRLSLEFASAAGYDPEAGVEVMQLVEEARDRALNQQTGSR
ncbi:MAG: M48 family metalloprotease [Phycisphaerales bacterium]|nr:MAG: M48 family metalloprotease [Phycisphaerales bacterium]